MSNSLINTVNLSVYYISDPDGSLPKKRLIFTPTSMNTANSLSPIKDISYEGDTSTFSGKYLIKPQNQLKLFWDLIVLSIIIIQGIYIPLLISFDFQVSLQFIYFDFSANLVLLLDIVLNFNTGYLKKGAIVMNRYLISKHYLKTWFIIDIFSSFPYEWIINQSIFSPENYKPAGSNLTKTAKFVGIVRISRILGIVKLMKLMKMKLYFYKIEDYLNNNCFVKFSLVIRVVIIVFYTAHWNACVWYLVTRYFIEGETWLNYSVSAGLNEEEAYLYSMYWSMYTMISVGYGNIKLQSTSERLLAIFSMVIGTGLFGYLAGEVSSFIQKETSQYTQYRELKTNLNLIMNKYKIPNELKYRIRNYIEHNYIDHCETLQEKDLINSLSLPLRGEISHIINWPVFQHCNLFPKLFEANVVESISYLFKKQYYSPYDHILKQSELERKMFFIISGTVELYMHKVKRLLMPLKDEDFFGEIGFFANLPRTASAISVGFSEILMLDYLSTWKLIEKFPRQLKILIEVEELCKEDLNILGVKCWFCDNFGHAASGCFELSFRSERERVCEKWMMKKRKNKEKIGLKGYSKSNFKRKYRNSLDITPIRRRNGVIGSMLKDKILGFFEHEDNGEEDKGVLGVTKTINYDHIVDSDSSLSDKIDFYTYEGTVIDNDCEENRLKTTN